MPLYTSDSLYRRQKPIINHIFCENDSLFNLYVIPEWVKYVNLEGEAPIGLLNTAAYLPLGLMKRSKRLLKQLQHKRINLRRKLSARNSRHRFENLDFKKLSLREHPVFVSLGLATGKLRALGRGTVSRFGLHRFFPDLCNTLTLRFQPPSGTQQSKYQRNRHYNCYGNAALLTGTTTLAD